MPEIIDRRIAFNAGEISPWTDPRLDLDKYRMGCRQLQNMRPMIYGGAMRRAGTVYLGAALTADKAIRLIPFTREVSTNYVLEFSRRAVRIWDVATQTLVTSVVDHAWTTAFAYVAGDVVSYSGSNYIVTVNHTSGTFATDLAAAKLGLYPYQVITTPYTEDQLETIQYAAQNDVLFLTHPTHFPRTITRMASGKWTCDVINITWPVTLGPNTTQTTITPLVDIYHPTEPSAWSAGAYVVGNERKHNSLYYLCIEDTSEEPGTAAALGKWIEGRWITGTGPTSAAAYDATVYYVDNDKMTYGGNTWKRRKASSGLVKGHTPDDDDSTMDLWTLVSSDPVETGLEMVQTGSSRIFKSSTGIFTADHVGTQWVIGHRREELTVNYMPTTEAVGFTSDPLYVLGEWTCRISQPTTPSSDYEMRVVIERSTDLLTWETHHAVESSRSNVQQLVTGSEESPLFLRLRHAVETGTVPTLLMVELTAGNSVQWGIVEITAYTSTTQVTATVLTPIYRYLPTTRWEEPAWNATNGYPRAVALHESRLFYGGCTRKPTTVWGSAVDAYQDFRIAAEDDRAVSYTLASNESSTIEWLVSQDMLVIGTTSGEWAFGTKAGEDAPKLRKNTSYGSAPVQAFPVGDALIHLQRSRRKAREFAWSFDRDGYASNDLTLLSEHLGDAEFRQLAIQRNPENIVWVVTTRGDLLSLTYERGQNVAGWARHVTDGTIESVAVVPGSGEEDQVWVAVLRTVNAATVRYIERLQPDIARALKNATHEDFVFVDCAKKYSGSGLTSITGMTHLANRTVSVIGDGKAQANRTVSAGGTLTVTAADEVIIGLPYTSYFEPTYLETPDPNSMSKVAKKRLHRVAVEFWKSTGMEISADAGTTWQPFAFQVTPTFDAVAGTLFTGIQEHYMDGGSERQSSLVIRQAAAAPLAVMSIGMRYNLEIA